MDNYTSPEMEVVYFDADIKTGSEEDETTPLSMAL